MDLLHQQRRRFLTDVSSGLGSAALAWLWQTDALADVASSRAGVGASRAAPHFPPQAKRAIHIFSPGGVSQVDTFDYKPELERFDGKLLTGKGELDTFFGRPGVLRKSFYGFKQYGESGSWVSDLFPHLAGCVDDLTFFHAMVTKSSSHTPACFQMNSGFTQSGYPSLGSWLSYGLGSENDELPTFVVLPDPRGLPNGGTNNWSNGFLPAQHQGTAFRTGKPEPIPNLHTPDDVSPTERNAGLDLLSSLNRNFADANPGESELTARIRSYELAAKMQTSIPEAVDFKEETAATQSLYGLDDERCAGFGRNCILARRLLERGVRFVQLYNGGPLGGTPRINWDAHEDVRRNHDANGVQLDKPCAGLLQDLKRRGMLDDTLVIWSSEFGRTPFTEGAQGKGRDHHPQVFTTWMAGAGLKQGHHHGASDEVGYLPAENATSVYDFHATVLHLLGVDHTRLTHYHNGIQRRLTDVHGEVVESVLA